MHNQPTSHFPVLPSLTPPPPLPAQSHPGPACGRHLEPAAGPPCNSPLPSMAPPSGTPLLSGRSRAVNTTVLPPMDTRRVSRPPVPWLARRPSREDSADRPDRADRLPGPRMTRFATRTRVAQPLVCCPTSATRAARAKRCTARGGGVVVAQRGIPGSAKQVASTMGWMVGVHGRGVVLQTFVHQRARSVLGVHPDLVGWHIQPVQVLVRGLQPRDALLYLPPPPRERPRQQRPLHTNASGGRIVVRHDGCQRAHSCCRPPPLPRPHDCAAGRGNHRTLVANPFVARAAATAPAATRAAASLMRSEVFFFFSSSPSIASRKVLRRCKK